MATHRKRGRPAKLSRRLILATAGDMDLRSLSIVKLARALDVSDAAIYYYFSTRAALVRALVDQGSGAIEIPAIDQEWWVGLRCYALRVYDALIERPGAAQSIIGGGVAGPTQMKIFSTIIQGLVNAGQDHHDAVRIYIVYFRAALYAAFAHDERMTVGDRGLGSSERAKLAAEAGLNVEVALSSFIEQPEITDSRSQLEFLLMVLGEGFSGRSR